MFKQFIYTKTNGVDKMNKVTLKNGMVYQKGKRIERLNIFICDGIIEEISADVLSGHIIDCNDMLIAPGFNNSDCGELVNTSFNVLYNNLVRTHKMTLEKLLDSMSNLEIKVGNIANFAFIDICNEPLTKVSLPLNVLEALNV